MNLTATLICCENYFVWMNTKYLRSARQGNNIVSPLTHGKPIKGGLANFGVVHPELIAGLDTPHLGMILR